MRTRSSSGTPGQLEALLEVDLLARDLGGDEDEVVRVEEPADVRLRQEPLVARIAQALEAVLLEAPERVDRAELIRDEDAAAGPCDAGQLRDGELGPPHVVQEPKAARDVEAPITERERRHLALLEAHVLGSDRAARLEVVGVGVDADDLAHARRERERERPHAAARVERDLGARERAEQPADALRERRPPAPPAARA